MYLVYSHVYGNSSVLELYMLRSNLKLNFVSEDNVDNRPKTSRNVPTPTPDERDSYIFPSPPAPFRPANVTEVESYDSEYSYDTIRPSTSRIVPCPSPEQRDNYIVQTAAMSPPPPLSGQHNIKRSKNGTITSNSQRNKEIALKGQLLFALLLQK